MPVAFEDYYQTLGVKRNASADEIKRAYRKLAQQYHPDRNQDADAHEQFSKIGEAYEVLKDPEKRKKYDRLGANWKQGEQFRPSSDATAARAAVPAAPSAATPPKPRASKRSTSPSACTRPTTAAPASSTSPAGPQARGRSTSRCPPASNPAARSASRAKGCC